MQVLVFEDSRVLDLKPLVNLKPVYGLYAGFRSLQEKLKHSIRGEVKLTYHLRGYLAPFYAEQHAECVVNRLEDKEVLLINGRIVFNQAAARVIIEGLFDPGTAYMQGDDLLFARVQASLITDSAGLMPDLIDTSVLSGQLVTQAVTGFRIISNLWDLVAFILTSCSRMLKRLNLGVLRGRFTLRLPLSTVRIFMLALVQLFGLEPFLMLMKGLWQLVPTQLLIRRLS